MGMSDLLTRQRRPIWIVVLLFAVGVFGIIIWDPVLVQEFPRKQFLEWYIVSGLLLIGLTAASKGETVYAPAFGLYALAIALLVATPIPELLAQLGALVCLVLGVLLAHGTDRTNTDSTSE